MAEIVLAIIGPVVECLVAPVTKHLGYLFLSTKHVKKLREEKARLEGTSVDVEKHMDRNQREDLEVPARVPGWLEQVAKIKGDAETTISSNENNGCFNIKARYQMGRNASKTAQEIETLLQQVPCDWTNAQKPLGRQYTRSASSSGGDSIGEDFNSRATTFDEALRLLQQDQNTQVIALCGMGGVGKTTLMEQLKKVTQDKNMFNWIVKVGIGAQPNWYSIQQAVAENLGSSLKEEAETTRADRLRKRFEETLKKSEKGILVILDDVWEKVELKDIGLSPFPNRVKLILTSRNEDFCKQIAVHEGNLDLKVLQVGVLEHQEAHNFLCKITNISKESDPDLYKIGGEIVKKCSCLPLAIKLIARTLISEEKSIWRNRLRRLKKGGPHPDVQEIIKISYNYLDEEEDKEILLLCGLFPEDSNIPTEDLTRYAWGLNLFKGVSTFRDARDGTITCTSNLRKANLLIDGDFPGCVKMHDLVLAFVLATLETGDHASFINHEGWSKWSGEGMRDSCKRLSLTCTGMSEFPEGFKCPNVSLLKLMHGHDPAAVHLFEKTDDQFKFPEGFYENTEKLQVIAYGRMQYPLLPRPLQSGSTNLRTLCLHECSLMFDISFIGDLSNLEVLSITKCKIPKLPSAIGKLKKLKVLDLTACLDLVIDDGILKKLVNLEEIYMIASNGFKRGIRLTDANVDEFGGCSKNLTALAIEFNALPQNISFEKLERFKISSGCNLDEVNRQSWYGFENTLKLVIDKCKLLDSTNKLFDKVEVLHLELNGVDDHQDALAESLHHHRSSFYNLRVLSICNCQNLTYLFTVPVANGLRKLERLTISSCSVLETVIDGNKCGVGAIIFQALKFLSLYKLPNLKSLYNTIDVIELPQLLELRLNGLPEVTSIYPSKTSSMSSNISEGQSLLNEEVVIPNLREQHIRDMENLKEIWPCQFGSGKEVNVCKLRKLHVYGCNSLVNLFPSNPMSLLHHLEELTVEKCSSVEVLFNIDLECVGNIDEARCCLRSIRVSSSENLRHVWSIKGANDFDRVIRSFRAIEGIMIWDCKSFRNVFTPKTTNFEMKELTNLTIHCGGSDRHWKKTRQEQEINVMPNEDISKVDDTTDDFVLSSNLIHTFRHVHKLHIYNHKRAKFLIPPYSQQPQGFSSSFHNLTTISLQRCSNIKYLFSPVMAKLLSNLKKVTIKSCHVFEEVVSNRDDEDEELVASMSTNLDMLYLEDLSNLKRIGGGSGAKGGTRGKEISSITLIHDQSKLSQVNDVAWSLCQYTREIQIYSCQALPYVIPSYALGQMQKLEKLRITQCKSLVEVFDTQGFNINDCDTTNFDEGSGGNDATITRRIKKIVVPQLSNLKELEIYGCDVLQHVITFSMLESLTQLKKLSIRNCKAMKVIVQEDNEEPTTISSKVAEFPHLKSIELGDLPNLTGFFLGENEFRWPLLDDVFIDGCPQMMMFTFGCSITPNLNYIRTKLGKYSTLECGLNFRVMATTLHESAFTSLDITNSCATTSETVPWSFHNLIEMDVQSNSDVSKIIPSNELQQLQKLEKIWVIDCHSEELEEIFEALEGKDNSELQSNVMKIPNLREVVLQGVGNLKYIHKPSMVLEFPNLTKVAIFACTKIEYVFSSSMVDSLPQLQVLHIQNCLNIEVIVKGTTAIVEEGEGEGEGECDDTVNGIILLPRLRYLKLDYLPSLKGFYLGKEDCSLPSLDALEIKHCSQMSVFTRGDVSTPKLKVVDTSFGRCELVKEENLNSFIDAKLKEGFEF